MREGDMEWIGKEKELKRGREGEMGGGARRAAQRFQPRENRRDEGGVEGRARDGGGAAGEKLRVES